MAVVSFSSTYLASKNKKGVLKPDSNGYYDVIVGGLNIHNSAGDYYVLNESKDLFENSTFKRRIQNGALKGENGHPRREPGMSDDAFLDRFLTIVESNVCVHYSDIWLDFNSVKDSAGRPVVAIMAKAKPSGPLAAVLENSLNDPNQNTAFSVRGFTKDIQMGSIKHRILKTIITFDHVVEPGISIATKWNNPALESLHEEKLKEHNLLSFTKSVEATHSATEAKLLLSELSWIEKESVFSNDINKPIYTKW